MYHLKTKILMFLSLSIFIILNCVACNTTTIPKVAAATANVKEMTRITHGDPAEFFPRPSPDGSKIFFHVRDDTKGLDPIFNPEAWSIAIMETHNTSERQLVAGPYAQSPNWLPDGSGFLYQYLKTEKPVLVRSSLKGFGISFLTQQAMGDSDGHPTVSPNGEKIVFHTIIGGAYHICSVSGDGSGFTIYVEGCAPDMHPNRDMVVFQRLVGEYAQIFVFNLETGQITQLTNGNFHSVNPSWSPDGRWIAFASSKDGPQHIYIMRENGTKVTQLTSGGSEDGGAVWSMDGNIYFHSNAGENPGILDRFPDMNDIRRLVFNPYAPFNNCGLFFRKWLTSDIWKLRPNLPQ